MDLPLFEGDGYEEEGGDCQEVTWGGGRGRVQSIYICFAFGFLYFILHMFYSLYVIKLVIEAGWHKVITHSGTKNYKITNPPSHNPP